jgi:predicted AlkP superfamily phosphohydrolase/phosphomutase
VNKLFFLGYIDPGSGFVISTLCGWLISILVGLGGIIAIFLKRIIKFFKRHKKFRKIILYISILSIIIVALGVIMAGLVSKFNKRIVILGFDSLSYEILSSMLNEGSLANFSYLKENGTFALLSTTNPAQSPVAWAGFATGKNPGKNGIFDFIVRDPKTYKLDLSSVKFIQGRPKRTLKSKFFWQYLSDTGIPVTIISCPLTFPPQKLYGRLLSGMGVPDILGTEGTFTFYTTQDLNNNKDIGGNVFKIDKSAVMTMELIGPKVTKALDKASNVKVPFKATLEEGKDSICIEYQNNKFEIKRGQWSDWKEVLFKLSFLKKMRGIFKFYLAEINPEFKLYISPINFDPREPFFAISYPKIYSQELADNIGIYHTRGMPYDTWALNEKRITEDAFLEQANGVFEERKRMLDFELKRLRKGLLFCYFEDPDIIQHMFWRYIDPQHPLYEKDAPQEYRKTIKKCYESMDDILGSVMRRLNKEDTLIVLSDHGFGSFRRAVHINSWLRRNGYLELKNPSAESGAELLADIDWSKTKAYAIGFGAIYINQKEREKYGIVAAGPDTEELKTEISEKLEKWFDEKYREPIIHKVYKQQEIFSGDYRKDCPDLYVGFNLGYRASWQTAIGGVPKELIEDNLKKWSGDHLFDPHLIPGVIFSNRKIIKDNPAIYDIAPTILKIMGIGQDKLKKYNLDAEALF